VNCLKILSVICLIPNWSRNMKRGNLSVLLICGNFSKKRFLNSWFSTDTFKMQLFALGHDSEFKHFASLPLMFCCKVTKRLLSYSLKSTFSFKFSFVMVLQY